MCGTISICDYDVVIDSNYYTHDFDVIDFENQSEKNTESDVLFE